MLNAPLVPLQIDYEVKYRVDYHIIIGCLGYLLKPYLHKLGRQLSSFLILNN